MNTDALHVVPIYLACTGEAARDRDIVLSVWQGALGQVSRPHAAKFDWFYLGCPWGTPLLELLKYTPTAACVGTTAAAPRRMLWQGQEIRAGVLVDMAVAVQHRTLGPALILQSGLQAAAAARFDLLYGFPNPKAIAVANRAGYPLIGALGRFSCVLRHGSYFARLMPRHLAQPLGWLLDTWRDAQRAIRARRGPHLIATWCNRVDPKMDKLWHDSAHGDGLVAVRDATLLQWRFDKNPGAVTRYLCLSEYSDGPLLAWFACQVDGSTLHVRDFWSRDAARGLPRSQIETLLHAAREDEGEHAVVSLEYAAPASKLSGWQAAGFVERECRSIIGRWLTGNTTEITDLHLTAADEDE